MTLRKCGEDAFTFEWLRDDAEGFKEASGGGEAEETNAGEKGGSAHLAKYR
jgi:hypothetical protein